MNFTEVVLNRNKLNFKATAYEDINDELKVEFQIERCLQQDSPGTCERYHTLKVPYYCRILSNIEAWSSFLNSIEPAWKCPFKKGIYVTKKTIKFNAGDIGVLGMGGHYYWKVKAMTYAQKTKKLVLCLLVEGKTDI